MALPCALFSSSSNSFRPEDFVKGILRVSTLPVPTSPVTGKNDNIQRYKWDFETKYYTATIHLCTTNTRTIGDQEFADSLDAFIHFFDPQEPASFDLAKAWLPYLNQIEPVVQMLVCQTSRHTDAISRKEAQEWCLQNGFELVELEPEECSEDEEDDFPETTGMARIIQALHAHTWPNLVMKDSPPVQSPYLRQMMKEQHLLNKQNQTAEHNLTNSDSQKSSTEVSNGDLKSNTLNDKTVSNCDTPEPSLSEENSQSNDSNSASASSAIQSNINVEKDTALDEDDLLGVDTVDWKMLLASDNQGNQEGHLGGEDMEIEEFEQVFRKLALMKGKAEKMPLDERKKYAEKVAISFWKAVGGDEEEILGLDEDSD